MIKTFLDVIVKNMNFLTEQERKELKIRHKKERDGRIRDRIKAILLYDEGWLPKDIAKVLLLSDEAVRNHIDEYKVSQKLQSENGGSMEKLSIEQSQKLEAHLQMHTYLYVKDIVTYVRITFGIIYTIPGMRSWLQRHGFSYKKPAIVPGKANEQQQKEWLVEYEKLRKELPDNETICFMDGVHPTHNVQSAYGWIKKGVRKEIATNTGRSRLNLSGIINIISHQIIIQEDKTLNAEATINFFRKIEKAYPDKVTIHLFCDNAKYYRNKAVKIYLATSRIKLHFLPPYSPNLNPIERLWKWMKEKVLYNAYYPDFESFRSAIFGFFFALTNLDLTSELGQSLKSRVRDKFRLIGAHSTNF